MSRGPKPEPITLTGQERDKLRDWSRRPTTQQRLAIRSRIVPAAAEGFPDAAIALDLRVTLPTVRKRRSRFATDRLDGLTDEPRPGTPRSITDSRIETALARTLESKPENATHWSTRSPAREPGLSRSAVSRIWRAFGPKPHPRESFKLSTDPFFTEKVRDVAGLYMAPPEKAIVLCVDEKSRIQALDRSQPTRPMLIDRPEKASHDYVRHGTTPLFAALDAAAGAVPGECHARHRHQEFIAFLDHIDARLAREEGTDIHVVMDNYGTHKHPAVKGWFARHPEYVPHFTPTSSSWLNQVERFFAKITEQRIRRGVFRSVDELERAIEDYLENHNENPGPFVRTKDADLILRKVQQVCERLNPAEQPETNF